MAHDAAREELEMIGAYDRKEDRLLEELTRLKSRWTSATSIMSDMPRPPSGHRDISDFLVAQEDIEERLKKCVDERKELRSRIELKLESLPPNVSQVLSYRYLCGWKWERIAEKMSYDLRYVHKLHARGLAEYRI